MLDPEYLRRITEGAEQIASLLHTELVKIIVQAIVTRMERGESYRLTARDRWMLEVLQAAGYLRGDLEREIAAKTKLMLREMKEAFEDAGVRSLAWDDAVYIAAGMEPTPLRQSPQLIRLLERGYEKTAGEWVNFTGTTADASQQLFIRECDKAYSLVASGGMSHAQAVRQAVEAVAREGVRVTYPTGHTDTVETAVARAVRTGVGQACGEMSMARMRQMGWKIVLVSAHLGARTGDGGEDHTNHFWWQGKFYRLDDEDGTEDAAQQQEEAAQAAADLENEREAIAGGLGRQTKNTGSFAHLPERMSKKHIRAIAAEYRIPLKGIKIFIDQDEDKLRPGFTMSGRADTQRVGRIDFFPNAFLSKEELTRTLFHERIHVEQFREYGAVYVQNNRDYFEQLAYAAENEFIENLRREGKL